MKKVLLVYDIAEKRLPVVYKICKKYLHWIQNSVFEGELTRGKINALIRELERVINEEEDSVVLYIYSKNSEIGRISLGLQVEEGDDFMI